MKYENYTQGYGAFEIDLNDPVETAKVASIDDVIARARTRARHERDNQKLNDILSESSPYHSQHYARIAEEYDQLADWLEELKVYRKNSKEIKYKPICLNNFYSCGVCHAGIGYYGDYNYCWNCGKKIDWEEVKI